MAEVDIHSGRQGYAMLGYADAVWRNNIVDCKSFSGYTFTLSGVSISWRSRKQKSVALSSTEAEYMRITEAAKETIYLITHLKELGCKKLAKTAIFNNNQSVGKLASNPVFHSRSKHIDVRYHFIRDVLLTYPVKLEYLPTEDVIADVLTKPLQSPKHTFRVEGLGIVLVSHATGTGCIC